MVGAVSVGSVDSAFSHLLTLALFKALLFICAGVIIHTMKDSQDICFIGNLSFQMPFTSVCYVLCGDFNLSYFYFISEK
jgi:NADH:ubiquinone oxidoreductase subunit 5 (subunit L)/multisubunit Na+/H+ antiporter MnhA subunit